MGGLFSSGDSGAGLAQLRALHERFQRQNAQNAALMADILALQNNMKELVEKLNELQKSAYAPVDEYNALKIFIDDSHIAIKRLAKTKSLLYGAKGAGKSLFLKCIDSSMPDPSQSITDGTKSLIHYDHFIDSIGCHITFEKLMRMFVLLFIEGFPENLIVFHESTRFNRPKFELSVLGIDNYYNVIVCHQQVFSDGNMNKAVDTVHFPGWYNYCAGLGYPMLRYSDPVGKLDSFGPFLKTFFRNDQYVSLPCYEEHLRLIQNPDGIQAKKVVLCKLLRKYLLMSNADGERDLKFMNDTTPV